MHVYAYAMKTCLGRRALNLASLCSAVSWRRPGGPGTWAAIISLASLPPLGHLYRPATCNTHYALRRLATSFSVKCKQRSQTSSDLVLSQMTVQHAQANQQTNKQANRKSINTLVWGSLRLAPISSSHRLYPQNSEKRLYRYKNSDSYSLWHDS